MQIHRVLSIKYSTEGDHVLSPTTSIRLFIATRILAMKKHRLILSLSFSLSIPRSMLSFEIFARETERGRGKKREERKEGKRKGRRKGKRLLFRKRLGNG